MYYVKKYTSCFFNSCSSKPMQKLEGQTGFSPSSHFTKFHSPSSALPKQFLRHSLTLKRGKKVNNNNKGIFCRIKMTNLKHDLQVTEFCCSPDRFLPSLEVFCCTLAEMLPKLPKMRKLLPIPAPDFQMPQLYTSLPGPCKETDTETNFR